MIRKRRVGAAMVRGETSHRHPRIVPMNTHICDTLRSRKPGSLRAMPSQFEISCAI